MAFEWEYPLFFVAREATTDVSLSVPNVTFHDIVTLSDPNKPSGVAVFTDRAAAEQFRDEYAAVSEVFELPTAGAFAVMLQQVRKIAQTVAFDPYRLGYQTQVAPIEDVLRGL
ncbi:hypothetical protein GobsT_11340 [Gemmata obscuriglobus]|uniref:Uncharacterized protein n=1 Tax=Gemmata obscuriglobus TaxID=114 RepID=A0A2Z3H9S6_9BACT|nr:hypothetical protein [Gemmata obscuriglobus]AWM40376.1 hypothetical protein C1280_27540 [Gemmata obscuriglobus]QEG26395.1 hypothetical protein GobsT_11340 [Gemmata obscuriglobus]VTS01474.1 unnamed protein product [Gemmata obscuriglobus UQM 2246]